MLINKKTITTVLKEDMLMEQKLSLLITIVCLFCLISSVGYSQDNINCSNPATDTDSNKVVIDINNLSITKEDISLRNDLYQILTDNYDTDHVIDRLIEEKSVISQAAEKGVLPSQEDLYAEIEKVRDLLSENEDVLNKLNMDKEEYILKYEYDFKYYLLCLTNLTNKLNEEAESLNVDASLYNQQKREEWKHSAKVSVYDPNISINLDKSIIGWEKIKAYNENVKNASYPVLLDDSQYGKTFANSQYYKLPFKHPDYGILSAASSIYIQGSIREESGYKWLGPTDIFVHRENNYPSEVESLISATLTKVNISRNNSLLGDYKNNFSDGLFNQYLTNYRKYLTKKWIGGRLSSSGTYSIEAVASIHISEIKEVGISVTVNNI